MTDITAQVSKINLMESHADHYNSDGRMHFSIEEYKSRLLKVKQAMQIQNIDLLIISDPSNIAWLTGYDGWSFYTHQCALLHIDHTPIWYGRRMDAEGARKTVYIPQQDILSYPDHYVQSANNHPMILLSQIIRKKGWHTGIIAAEMDNYYFSAACYVLLKKHLPYAQLIDATGLINWQRSIKSPREIAYMKKAGQIVSRMHRRIYEKIEPGMRKNDLVAEIYDAAIRGTSEFGGDYPAIVPMLPSGKEAAAPHLTWDDKPLEKGQGTFFEIAGCYRRYHAPLSRTVFLGEPPEIFSRLEAAVGEGLEAGLAIAKPGTSCEEMALAFYSILKKHGFDKDGRTGYAIGLSYPPDWGERTMSLRRGDKSILKEGMAFHFMPGIWLENLGFEMTESIVITKTGYELLANVPRELFIKK